MSKERIGDPDPVALEARLLVEEHSGRLYQLALRLTGRPEDAEDLVQETFLRALERGSSFRGEASLGTWLFRILHNLAVDRARRGGREFSVEAVEERWGADSYTVDAAIVVEQAAQREELEDALVRLPFVYRSAVLLHDVLDWTTKRLAEELGISLPAAKQRLRRGRMMLVSALADGHERREALAGVPMRCWDARRWISSYLDGELAPNRRAAIEAHLESCPTCPPLYSALVGATSCLGELRDPDSVVPPHVAERIAVALENRSSNQASAR